MKIRKSEYHQNSAKAARCGAPIWENFFTNFDAHLAEILFQTRSGVDFLTKRYYTCSHIDIQTYIFYI